MRKYILSLGVILVFATYAIYLRNGGNDNVNVVAPAGLTVSTSPGGTPPVPLTTTPAPQGQYKNGSYTGSVANAYYGNIQVQATISGGNLTDVVFLQYPSDRSTSRQINGQAMSYLKAEAIQAQSANVNIISGATDSSQAFIQSLGDALSQAKV